MNLKDYIRPGEGAGDITPLLGNSEAFQELVNKLAEQLRNLKITKIVSIEGRGFIIGSALAYALKLGFVPVRYPGKLKNAILSESYVDYSGSEKTIVIHQDALVKQEKVAIFDDWIETGATIKSIIKLVEKCEGNVVKVVAFIDDSSEELKKDLKEYDYSYLVKTEDSDPF